MGGQLQMFICVRARAAGTAFGRRDLTPTCAGRFEGGSSRLLRHRGELVGAERHARAALRLASVTADGAPQQERALLGRAGKAVTTAFRLHDKYVQLTGASPPLAVSRRFLSTPPDVGTLTTGASHSSAGSHASQSR